MFCCSNATQLKQKLTSSNQEHWQYDEKCIASQKSANICILEEGLKSRAQKLSKKVAFHGYGSLYIL